MASANTYGCICDRAVSDENGAGKDNRYSRGGAVCYLADLAIDKNENKKEKSTAGYYLSH